MTQKRKPLLERIGSGPLPADEGNAAEYLRELCEALKPLDGALAHTLASQTPLKTFFAGVLDGSDYLRELVLREPEILADTLSDDPQQRFDALLEAAVDKCRSCEDMQAVMRCLRQLKEKAALLICLTDLGGVWNVDEVTLALSRLAVTALNIAINWLLAQAAQAGRFIPTDDANPQEGSGLIVLGMGKLGAGELNFSSDIDIIVFYDADIAPLADGVEPGTFFTRLVRDLVKIMQERTRDGYVFRTDLRLRPDPGATAPAVNVAAALQYYESLAQNWERAAMIKAAPVAGDIKAGSDFLAEITPFVWRKHMDFAALADVHAMKRQIHAHKGHGAIAVAGHNVKLGRGGIREIEFFVQTQQLIAGGRNPALRTRKTLEALQRLEEAGWLSNDTHREQADAYRFLRMVEHRIQMLADEQTHDIPSTPESVERFARFCGFPNAEAFEAAILEQMRRVSFHYAQLFEDSPELSSATGSLVFTGDDDDPETLETLLKMGFANPVATIAAVKSWHYGRFSATRSAKAREALTEITPALLEAFGASDQPDAAFIAFDRFVRGLPAGVQLFSMLRSNPALLELLAMIMGTAPRLADIVAARPHTMDAILEPGFFDRLPGHDELETACDRFLGLSRDYEDFLDRCRIFNQEQSFLIGVRVLAGSLDGEAAGIAYSALADLLIARIAARALDEVAERHGHVDGACYAIVGLGRLGSCEMTATSDLDLIVIYDFAKSADTSDGEKPLSPGQYFSRYTQRFIAALSAPTSEGTLYEVDMRLRPSGRQGPLATHIDSFIQYQQGEAWIWEHMALTRARCVAGAPQLAKRIDGLRAELMEREREDGDLKQHIAEMRARIESGKQSGGRWDIKLAPGGIIDIEFIVQFLELSDGAFESAVTTLQKLRAAIASGRIDRATGDELLSALQLYQNLMQLMRLCISGPFDPQTSPEGLNGLLARFAGEPDLSQLEARLDDTQTRVREIFTGFFGTA
ncbi:MAG: bifunctional [glutamine synthetase] adenylyltransferase/[glutamine synthetase]-adenylyl-L-tyrosine phosphorylase [Rhodobiaceae bacterium]|nr:bifunctional [glutamine synthetase] adenylyltransferase/[glutamine synthetase]-adenylyl-L-tyrosine phosphorylase [Rhodobiaceae bacterium]MCC0054658.1 bifunctional [glutamine synthetase] adenylyltransferase/[glutamine synthetase]-adenylyl-L-tyrosine phosphorylase [Rhodobiaceae bacterium]